MYSFNDPIAVPDKWLNEILPGWFLSEVPDIPWLPPPT